MLLVHMSDLHCGKHSEFNPKALETAIDEINSLRPDVVVITGDLTHNGMINDYSLAKEYIDKINCERKIIGTGNHDYKLTGYLLCNKYFRRPQILDYKDVLMLYLSTARPDKDEGEVGYRQQLWFKKVLNEKRYQNKVKILCLHHHLIPIPDTGLERATVTDAGDVIRAIQQTDPNLILCGHRHRPWRLTLGKSTVINSGTVSSLRFRGFFANSYNIITIKNKNIDAKIKVVGGETISFEKLLRENKPFIFP